MIYYVDEGCDYRSLHINAGDKVLFKRGTVIRDTLDRVSGTPDAPVYYGAYGEGEKPIFTGAVDVSDPGLWSEVKDNVWSLKNPPCTDTCNVIFNSGAECGTMRFGESDLATQGDFYDDSYGCGKCGVPVKDGHTVLIYSCGNPALVYSKIELTVFKLYDSGTHIMSKNASNNVIEGLSFYGIGGHAIAGGGSVNCVIRDCDFRFIGGAVWNLERRIRYGNAIEFWNYCEDILIEGCRFDNVYDSCITEQGKKGECRSATRLVIRNNVFSNYGMAAYEGRDVMLKDSEFSDNVCLYAGGGFAANGVTTPRMSEIYPLPMGHHIFMWRIESPCEGGSFTIRDNVFYEATGAAIYSIDDPESDRQMRISGNRYKTSSELLQRLYGKDYKVGEFALLGEEGAVYGAPDDIPSSYLFVN